MARIETRRSEKNGSDGGIISSTQGIAEYHGVKKVESNNDMRCEISSESRQAECRDIFAIRMPLLNRWPPCVFLSSRDHLSSFGVRDLG